MTFTDEDGDGWHEFPHGGELLPFELLDNNAMFGVTWNDSWGGASENYDLYIMTDAASGSGYDEVTSERSSQSGRAADEPWEALQWWFEGGQNYYIAIRAADTSFPGRLNLLGYAVEFAYSMPEMSLTSPGDAPDVLTVGATYWSNDALEDYSSQGPTLDNRNKPEISAPAGVSSASYGQFFGTSASAPHVAGAAALVLSAFPDASADEVKNYLISNAIDRGDPGFDYAFGFGRLALPAAPTSSEPPPATGDPTGVVTSVWADHNVYVSGLKGMTVHASFDVQNMQSRNGTAMAAFWSTDTGAPLQDTNGSYATGGGQVAVWDGFVPRYAATRFGDFSLFMPYDELEVAAGDHELEFRVFIFDDATGRELASSNPSYFTFSRAGDTRTVATITNIETLHNVTRDGQAGMDIKVSFNINNHEGREGEASAYFYFDDGSNRPLKDFNDRYRTQAGNVAVGRSFTPGYNSATYDDFLLFMPYSELHMAADNRYDLKYYLVIWDAESWTELVTSGWVRFWYDNR